MTLYTDLLIYAYNTCLLFHHKEKGKLESSVSNIYGYIIHDKLSKIVFACYRTKASLAELNSNALH